MYVAVSISDNEFAGFLETDAGQRCQVIAPGEYAHVTKFLHVEVIGANVHRQMNPILLNQKAVSGRVHLKEYLEKEKVSLTMR